MFNHKHGKHLASHCNTLDAEKTCGNIAFSSESNLTWDEMLRDSFSDLIQSHALNTRDVVMKPDLFPPSDLLSNTNYHKTRGSLFCSWNICHRDSLQRLMPPSTLCVVLLFSFPPSRVENLHLSEGGQNYFHKNIKTLHASFTVLAFVLVMQ